MTKVLCVVGPTAVGKTRLGVALAKTFNGEVISGDSMQIYKGMDIGTAKVTEEETEGIPHHLIDVKRPDETYSVDEFQRTVRALIDDITAKGKLPIIVGGTGLYIKAVLYDYVFEDAEANPAAIQDKYKDWSDEALYERLMSVDETAAAKIHPHNRRRTLRALEIYETTGRTKSSAEDKQSHTMIYDALILGLTIDRERLHQRIHERVDFMMDAGLEDEVRGLIEQGALEDWQSMKAIGYREWFPYFAGDIAKGEVAERICAHSRQYAKRQYTWFRNQMPTEWMDVNPDHFDSTIDACGKEVTRWIQS